MKKKWTGERLEPFMFDETAIEHLHRYAIAREYVKGKTVLDIACGEGYGSNLLAATAEKVMGVDIDNDVITNATAKYRHPNLSFHQGPAEQIPFADNHFDVVVSFETLEHATEHEQIFSEIKRVLKPGGLLIISTPDKKYYTDLPGYNNPFHKKELYQHEFTALVERFFANSIYFHQKLMLASVILLPNETGLDTYEGNYNDFTKNNMSPVYIVAIASDEKLNKPSSSIFSGKFTFDDALREKEKAVKKTASYRLGHLLLSPVKWLNNTFKKAGHD